MKGALPSHQRLHPLLALAALAAVSSGARAGTFLNPADRSPSVVLAPDLLGVTYTAPGYHGVRSDVAIAPGSGFFYYEGHREVGNGEYGFGLATAASTLDDHAGFDAQSFGVDVSGGIWYAGQYVGGFPFAANDTYGIAVDYRGVHPVAYVIVREAAGAPEVVFRKVVLDQITAPVHVFLYGAPATTGVQQTINPGNDLGARPFRLDPVAALDAFAYRASEGLVRGWNPPPTIAATADEAMVVAGGVVVARATATAVGGGDLSGTVTWTESRGGRTHGGAVFAFPADRLGVHEITAQVTAPEGCTVTATARVTVIRAATIDSDQDELSFSQEAAAGTDPDRRDTDRDELADGREILQASTDPLDADTDGDGMRDGWEVRHALLPLQADGGGDPDADGFQNLAEHEADTDPRSDASWPGRGTVLLSLVDRSPSVQLSADRLGAIFTAPGVHGVRTDVRVAPGSGWSYFEGHRETAPGSYGFGVATGSASLDAPGGSSDQSLGVLATGEVRYAGQTVATFADPAIVAWYGFLIDYSGSTPRVHVVVDRATGAPHVLPPVALTGVTTPLRIFVFGEPATAGVQQTINAGADPVGRPFRYPAAYLAYLAGHAGAEFTGTGFGPEHAYAGRPEVARHDPVVLVQDASTNSEVVLSPDRLGASYGAFQKSAVRANQAMIGEFRYFEAHREVGPVNIGQGLINPFADIDPYCCVSTNPSNAPPSMSMNSGGGIWQNLVYVTGFPAANEHYGFAVDYRGARPIVHCIVGDQLITSLTLSDLFTPIVPMLYGDPAGPVLVNTVNFGTRPFRYDAAAILAGAGVDASALVVGWGEANVPPPQPNVPSTLAIASAPPSVLVGHAATLTATATDVDGGGASGFVEWSVEPGGASGIGPSFAFTPRRPGPHVVTARFVDSLGSSTSVSRTVRAIATGIEPR